MSFITSWSRANTAWLVCQQPSSTEFTSGSQRSRTI